MKLSMVIPCYNSEKTIKSVVDRIISIFEDCHYEWEMVLVNDCSKDGTWEKIVSLAREHSNITGISLAKNSGQHAAILAGFRQCTGSVILCSDDDGQTPVENIPRMVNMLLENNYDVVSAKYIGFEKKDSIRKLGTALYHVIFNAMLDKPADVELRVFMAAKKFVIDEVCKYTQPYTSVNGLILRVTHNIGNVEMVQHKRMEGKSGYSFKKLVRTWANSFTAFSIIPLRLTMYVRMAAAAAGFFALIAVVIRRLINTEVASGWTSTIGVLLIMSGLLMLGLGIVGEYIGRIYMCINGTPQYVIRDCTDSLQKSSQEKEEKNT